MIPPDLLVNGDCRASDTIPVGRVSLPGQPWELLAAHGAVRTSRGEGSTKRGAASRSNGNAAAKRMYRSKLLTSLEGQVAMYLNVSRQNVSLKLLKLILLIGKYTASSWLCALPVI